MSDKNSAFERMQQRAAEAQQNAVQKAEDEASTPQQVFLPGMNELMRAIPNHLSRAPLFAPVAAGRKKIHDGTVLYETESVTIKVWGKQLSEDLADIWLHAFYLASKVALGEPVVIHRAEFLRGLGRNDSGASYDWLHRGVMALSLSTIAIEVRKGDKTKYSIGNHPSSRVMQMLGGFDYNEKTEEYTLVIDPRWRQTFGNREYSLIDWGKRLQIGRGQDLAKSLQRLVATSADQIQRYSLEFLKERAQYTSPMRKFKEALEKAMRELERLEVIAGGRIENSTRGKEQAVWTKL